jgi:hypothetical protein
VNPLESIKGIGYALLVAGAIAAVGWGIHLIYKAGGDAREAAWLKRESDLNAQAATAIADRAKAVEQARAEGAASINAAATHYLEVNQNAKAEVDRLNACLRAGTCGMRVKPTQRADGGTAVPNTPGAIGNCNAAPATDLPAETGIALRDLAAEADAVVRQLTLAQGEIRTIRQACLLPDKR